MTVGLSISFGMLDVVNIAHPAVIILGSYIAYIANAALGRALMLAPKILLVDEPSVGLAPLLVARTVDVGGRSADELRNNDLIRTLYLGL